jgi:hypothetical protein
MFIPPISLKSPSPIIRGWYNRPVVAAVPKVPPHKLKKNGSQIRRIEISLNTRIFFSVRFTTERMT